MTYSLSSLEKKGGVITGSGLIGVRGEGEGGGLHGGFTLYDCMKMYALSTKREAKMTGYF